MPCLWVLGAHCPPLQRFCQAPVSPLLRDSRDCKPQPPSLTSGTTAGSHTRSWGQLSPQDCPYNTFWVRALSSVPGLAADAQVQTGSCRLCSRT